MLTALDTPPEILEEADRNFVEKIRELGWFRTSVLAYDEGPGFSYTTGFWLSANQPELIMFSMRRDIAHDVFWDLFRDGKNGRALPIGKRTDAVFGNGSAYAFRVAKNRYRDFLGWSNWFYRGGDFPCLQIVWSDREDVFPWEAGFASEFHGLQVDLTEHGWANEIGEPDNSA